jgi:hypothetical protein
MTTDAEREVPVPFPVVAALVQYLAGRPYMEVHELIAALQAANEKASPEDGRVVASRPQA